MRLRYMQREAVDATFNYWGEEAGHPLIDMATGCHASGTQILMFDGSTKPVELVAANDNLMGPDSKPRRVLRTVSGREMMYRVTPVKGESFVVNEGHILSLKTTSEGKKAARYPNSHVSGGRIENVRLSDWSGKSKSWKHIRKLWRAGVDFPANDNMPAVPAYIAGVMLGDGSLTHQACITSMDAEILDEVCDYVESLGVRCRVTKKPDNQAYGVFFPDQSANRSVPNRFTELLRNAGLWGQRCAEKHIPFPYKVGDRTTRLNVLAGLLDTDGHLSNGTGYDFIAKSQRMSRDVAFVARSLGFAAYVAECTKSSQTGNSGTYWRVSITGEVNEIPVRLSRKKAQVRKQIKNPLVTGFSIEPVGEGEYFGFELDGDHLYLTADFTVHHNTGKSITMATLMQEMVVGFPDMRVMNCTHVVELVEGNFLELVRLWPFAPAGIYAAALGRRDRTAQILFAQLQTVWNKAHEIGHVDVLVIDEVHLVPSDGSTMYRKLIDALLVINPDMKIVGFTATPFRLDSGRLDEGEDRLFDKVVYTYGIRQGIDDGYLTPITSKPTGTKYDLTGVGKAMGEYKRGEYAAAVDKDDLNARVVEEVMDTEGHRRKALFFCAGIDHATHMRDAVRKVGRTCEVLSGKTPKGERRAIIEAFKRGEIWGVANDNIMSTGTNVPGIDLIVDSYKTMSASRYVQRVGRGTRVIYPAGFDPETVGAEERRDAIARGIKPNCRYMDFAGNIDEHGPVDTIDPKRPGKGDGEAPIKLCPQCSEILHASIRVCWCCGHEFVFDDQPKIMNRPTDAPILSTDEPVWREVTGRTFRRHEKLGGLASVRVDYMLGMQNQREWICPGHTGFAKSKADRYWSSHHGARPFPSSVEEFLERADELAVTAEIRLKKNGKYYDVVGHKAGLAPANDNAVVSVKPARTNLTSTIHRPANDNAERERLRALADDFIPF